MADGGLSIAIAVSLASSAAGAYSQYQAASTQQDFANAQAELETKQVDVQIAQANAERSLREETRERQLRSELARQAAQFGASNISTNSGTPEILAQNAFSTLNRSARLDDLQTNQILTGLNLSLTDIEIGRQAANAQASSQKTAAVVGFVSDAAGTFTANRDLFKTNSATTPPIPGVKPTRS